MRLIDDWRKAYKFKSLQLGVIGATVTTIFLAAPEAALHAWALMPNDLKSMLPPDIIKYAGIFILGSSFVARLIDQPKIRDNKDE